MKFDCNLAKFYKGEKVCMIKCPISLDVKSKIEDELEELALIQDYLSRTGQEHEEFVSIKRREEFVFLDGAVRIPKILMLENSKGVTEILNRSGKKGQEILTKIAEIDENGQMHFDKDWFEKNLRPFVQVGLINDNDINFVKDVQDEKTSDIGSLQVVPSDKMKEEKNHEDAEKQRIAKAIGVDPEDILSVIRIEDRDGGSKLFNYDLKDTDKPLMARLRNNKFKVLSENEDGELKEMIGYEATPVSKQVASLLKDTSSGFTSIKPGDVKAGKTNPDQSKYDIYQIRRAGESMDDDSNNLLYVGCSGETDMNVIESRDNGEVRFARAPQSTVYPENIYLENSAGNIKKREVTYEGQEEEEKPVISFKDMEERRKIIEKLLETEIEIEELEGDYKSPEDKERLEQLYWDRATCLYDLDITEKEAVQIQQEYEEEYRRSGKIPRV